METVRLDEGKWGSNLPVFHMLSTGQVLNKVIYFSYPPLFSYPSLEKAKKSQTSLTCLQKVLSV